MSLNRRGTAPQQDQTISAAKKARHGPTTSHKSGQAAARKTRRDGSQQQFVRRSSDVVPDQFVDIRSTQPTIQARSGVPSEALRLTELYQLLYAGRCGAQSDEMMFRLADVARRRAAPGGERECRPHDLPRASPAATRAPLVRHRSSRERRGLVRHQLALSIVAVRCRFRQEGGNTRGAPTRRLSSYKRLEKFGPRGVGRKLSLSAGRGEWCRVSTPRGPRGPRHLLKVRSS